MSKFPKLLLSLAVVGSLGGGVSFADEIKDGKKVFKKCRACHAVGKKAKNKVGPHLNDLFGRTAGALEGYKFSKAMKAAGADGLVWNNDTIDQFVTKPKKLIKKTKMAFAGLKKEKDRANLMAYLKSFDSDAGSDAAKDDKPVDKEASGEQTTKTASTTDGATQPKTASGSGGKLNIGRLALTEEVKAWDIDVRYDGQGLPPGKGTVAEGEPIFTEQCASCHGDFGEGVDRWPVLAGGQGTLEDDRPEKTIGSYWPYTSTVFDYIRRAMPFGNARSLSDDEVYALTAYVLYLNDIVEDEDFELSKENFNSIRLPNEKNFIADTRNEEPHYKPVTEPCMKDCKPEPAKLLMRARVLDVTPDGDHEGSLD